MDPAMMMQGPQMKMIETCQKCKKDTCSNPFNFICSHVICQKCSLAPIGKQLKQCPICGTLSRPFEDLNLRTRTFSNSSSSTIPSTPSPPPLIIPTVTRNFDLDPNYGYNIDLKRFASPKSISHRNTPVYVPSTAPSTGTSLPNVSDQQYEQLVQQIALQQSPKLNQHSQPGYLSHSPPNCPPYSHIKYSPRSPSNYSSRSTSTNIPYGSQFESQAPQYMTQYPPPINEVLSILPFTANDCMRPTPHDNWNNLSQSPISLSHQPIFDLNHNSAKLQTQNNDSPAMKNLDYLRSNNTLSNYSECSHDTTGQVVKFLCTYCKTLICIFCSDDHLKHNPTVMENYPRETNDLMFSHVPQMLQHAMDVFNNNSQNIIQLEGNKRQAEMSINEQHDHLKYLLEENRLNLLNNLNIVNDNKVSRINEQQKALVASMKRWGKQINGDLPQPGAKDDLSNFLDEENKFLEEIGCKISPIENPVVDFIHNAEEIASELKKFGKIVTDSDLKRCKLEGENMIEAFIGKPCSFSLFCKDMIGQRITTGGEDIKAVLIAGVPQQRKPIILRIDDDQNGKYRIHFIPTDIISPTIKVFLRNKEVPGSSFSPLIKHPKQYSMLQNTQHFFGNTSNKEFDNLKKPWGVHCDRDGFIYATDRMNNCIRVFNPDHTLHHRFGSIGVSPGLLNRPTGITVDKKRRIIVADKDNHRIQIFSFEGEFIRSFGAQGTCEGKLHYPWGVDVNDKGVIAVSDTRNRRIQLFTPDGIFLTAIGGTNPKLAQVPLVNPRGVKFGPRGGLYVTDFNMHQILYIEGFITELGQDPKDHRIRYRAFGGNFEVIVKKFQESGILTSYDIYNPNNQAKRNRNSPAYDLLKRYLILFRPQGLTIDWNGNVMVTDSRHSRIKTYTPNGELIHTMDVDQPHYDDKPVANVDDPSDIAVSPTGKIYVVQEHFKAIKVIPH